MLRDNPHTKKMLNAAAAVQRYKQTYKRAGDLPVPTYLLMGRQSSGKTRWLSVMAGAKVGGAERDDTGTRCPVCYYFETSTETGYQVGSSLDAMEDVQIEQVHERVSQYMEGLSKTGTGFSQDPFHVRIRGKDCPSFTVVDLPGLMRDTAQAAAQKQIASIYSTWVQKESAIPLIVLKFLDEDKDMLKSDLDAIIQCIGKHWLAKALLFITKLDAAKTLSSAGGPKLSSVAAYLKKQDLEEPPVFLSLKPEFLGDKCDTPAVNEQTASFEELNKYFQDVKNVEAQNIPWFCEHLRLSEDQQQNIGIRAAIARLESLLVSRFMSGLSKVRSILQAELTSWEEAAQDLLDGEGSDPPEDLLRAHIRLLCLVTEGVATVDPQRRINDPIHEFRLDFPNHIRAEYETEVTAKIREQTEKTFSMEQREMESRNSHTASCFLVLPKVQERLASDPDHILTHQMDFPLCSGAAVWRLLHRMGFALLAEPLRERSLAEIFALNNGGDLNAVRGMGVQHVLRKMVAELKPDLKSLQVVTDWVAHIYASQASVVCEALKGTVCLLQRYPKLQEHINNLFIQQYGGILRDLSEKALRKMEGIFSFRFTTLKLEEPMTTLRVLACSKLVAGIVEVELDRQEVDQGLGRTHRERLAGGRHSEEAQHDVPTLLAKGALALGAGAGTGAAKALVEQAVKHGDLTSIFLQRSIVAQDVAEGLPRHEEAAADFHRLAHHLLSGKAEVSLHDMAVGKGLVAREVGPTQIAAHVKPLNEAAHSYARICRGSAWQECQSVVENDVVLATQGICNTVRGKLDKIAQQLLKPDPDTQALWKALTCNEEHVEEAAKRMHIHGQDIVDIVTAVCDAQSQPEAPELARARGVLRELAAKTSSVGSSADGAPATGTRMSPEELGQRLADFARKLEEERREGKNDGDVRSKLRAQRQKVNRLELENQQLAKMNRQHANMARELELAKVQEVAKVESEMKDAVQKARDNAAVLQRELEQLKKKAAKLACEKVQLLETVGQLRKTIQEKEEAEKKEDAELEPETMMAHAAARAAGRRGGGGAGGIEELEEEEPDHEEGADEKGEPGVSDEVEEEEEEDDLRLDW